MTLEAHVGQRCKERPQLRYFDLWYANDLEVRTVIEGFVNFDVHLDPLVVNEDRMVGHLAPPGEVINSRGNRCP